MVKELKIGILAIITIFFMIWGYQFVKGKNIFSNVKTFHAIFSNVQQLDVAAPVMINGYQVGSVSNIQLNPQNVNTLIVSLEVDGKINYPKDTKAVLAQGGIVSGKIIILEFKDLCEKEDCAENHDTLQSEVRGFVESLVGVSNLENYYQSIKAAASEVFDTLSSELQDEGSESPINQIVWDLQTTLKNLASISGTLSRFMDNSYQNLDSTLYNMNKISGTLAESNDQIKMMLDNMEVITNQIRQADVGKTFESTTTAIDTITNVFTQMRSTLDEANSAFTKMENILNKMDSGEGSLANLINDPALYENLEKTSYNLSLLLQDLRLNPRRYFNLSIIGKKTDKYTLPEDDPALQKKEN